MLQYETPAEYQSFIAIDRIAGSRNSFWLPRNGGTSPLADVSAETIFFYVKRWFARSRSTDRSADTLKAVLQEIYDKLWSAATERDDPIVASASEWQQDQDHISFRSDVTESQVVSNAWKRSLYLDRELVKLRCEYLVSLAAFGYSFGRAVEMQISLQVIKKILELPRRLCDGSQISRRILRICAMACMIFLDPSPEGVQELRDMSVPPNDIEQCEFCDHPVEFENLTWARCANGHQFTRCSSTFLAVQAPGISKYCGICGKQYLSDQYVFEQDAALDETAPTVNGGGESSSMDAPSTDAAGLEGGHQEQGTNAAEPRPPITLAQLLVAACVFCVYCGGKFV
ncbi:hypothetical protein H2201_007260 [Coniosporium apollinis]|uniref:Transcription factor IIIC putative zinc-finger domain-containing protein n=1 Tax=Coniosporium apollinis TaxID=61459 RepID=A0ABQ9NLC7_9PEZI|nr:hypothetical protein H2201_007260 [Coniosporium apollinis]